MHACREACEYTSQSLIEVSANQIQCFTVSAILITILPKCCYYNIFYDENRTLEIPSFIATADHKKSKWNEIGWYQATEPCWPLVPYKRKKKNQQVIQTSSLWNPVSPHCESPLPNWDVKLIYAHKIAEGTENKDAEKKKKKKETATWTTHFAINQSLCSDWTAQCSAVLRDIFNLWSPSFGCHVIA